MKGPICNKILATLLNGSCNYDYEDKRKDANKRRVFVRTANTSQKRNQSKTVEIIRHSTDFSKTKELVVEIISALRSNIEPIPVNGGLGGSYNFRNLKGESVAIVKTIDEEPLVPNNPNGFVGKVLGQPGLKQSVKVGETGFREVTAYHLDHDHFARVPLTCLVNITHSIFNLNDCYQERDSK